MNEGENINKLVDELIGVLDALKLNWEIIAIDSPSKDPSYKYLEAYSQKYPNFRSIYLNQKRKAGSGKTFQYMLGFSLAKGRLIGQMDTDGQDNPSDLHKFLGKIEEGFDMVVGHKQNRKDGKMYMFTSKISNYLTSRLTGVYVHDMNCGFKVYQAYAAKSLNLTGRLYRFIPMLLVAKGFKITEVPIENRKREHGKTNFSFFNRLQGGLFDMPLAILLVKYSDVPFYLWGWFGVIFFSIGAIAFLMALILGTLSEIDINMLLMITLSLSALLHAILLPLYIGILYEFYRFEKPFRWEPSEIRSSSNLRE